MLRITRNYIHTNKPSGHIFPLDFIGIFPVGKLCTVCNISCFVQCYIMKTYKMSILRSKNISLNEVCTFLNSPLQKIQCVSLNLP
jgi:hypothetical protein